MALAELKPELAAALTDGRLQLHHAAQLATAAGISYLAARPDDSHTNLEWVPALGALASRSIPAGSGFRVGVRASDLTLLVTDLSTRERGAYSLNGRTMANAAAWLGGELTRAGVDARRYTLSRHYEIPAHAVARGAAFDARTTAVFSELAKWIGNAASVLEARAAASVNASEVRCWPHHFDIATLFDFGESRTSGVGLELGDQYYAEPYYYVNLHPAPPASAVTAPLAGGGTWHTHEWIGAVLPGSRLVRGAAAQELQIGAFLDSAACAVREVLGAS